MNWASVNLDWDKVQDFIPVKMWIPNIYLNITVIWNNHDCCCFWGFFGTFIRCLFFFFLDWKPFYRLDRLHGDSCDHLVYWAIAGGFLMCLLKMGNMAVELLTFLITSQTFNLKKKFVAYFCWFSVILRNSYGVSYGVSMHHKEFINKW